MGASGWSHPEWVGPFYPVQLRERPELWLDRYAERFRTVEVTSSFDAFPDEDLVEAWSRDGARLQERGPFEYSLKLPRRITHEALPAGDHAAAREEAGRFDREVLDPLDGEGLLGAVLVQLPTHLPASEQAVRGIQEILGALAERRVSLDLRHGTWLPHGNVASVAERLFASRDVCLVESDHPGAPRDARAPIDAKHAYVRFHGRRGDAWTSPEGEHDPERYNYLYRTEELVPWATRAKHHEAAGRDTRIYFHNHPGGKAVANALEFREMLGIGAAGPRPKLTEQRRLPV